MDIEGKLSLILPAHNEEDNLERVVNNSIRTLVKHVRDWEIIVVDDGSTDGTGRIAGDLASLDDRIRVVRHPRNLGYGASWRTGFREARGEYLMCMDSDGQFDLSDLSLLLPYVGDYDIVAGFRLDRKDPAHRRLNAAIFRVATRLFFGIRLRDLDCGFKIFRACLIRSLPLQSSGALINLEIFSYARLRGVRVREVGVHHYPRTAGDPTGAKVSVVAQAMLEFWALKMRVLREAYRTREASRLLAGVDADGSPPVTLGRRFLQR